jgi:uncharacterized protein YebE (UPF0316 family)
MIQVSKILIRYSLDIHARSCSDGYGERAYLPGKFEDHSPCDLIFTVITRLELRRLKNLVHEVDPKAFVFVNSIKETAGGLLKRSSGH